MKDSTLYLIIMEIVSLLKDDVVNLNQIQKNEFVFLVIEDFSPEIDQSAVLQKIEPFTNQSTKTCLYLNTTDFESKVLQRYLSSTNTRWVGVGINVGSGAILESNVIYSNVDALSFKDFEAARALISEPQKLVPIFKITDNHFQLGPTIYKFFERFDLDFAFIDPGFGKSEEQVLKIREAFEYLRLRGFKRALYFPFNRYFERWNSRTFNTFSGLTVAHIDLSNKCTHSCVFCGLWGPDFIEALKKEQGGTLTPETKKFMNLQMNFDRAKEVIAKLPETLRTVQFGGSGDPLTHPNWLEIIDSVRGRGIRTEVLSNFEYPTFNQIEALHKLSQGKEELCFYVNISAATAETYVAVRPRQSHETFEKVVLNLAYAANLKSRDGFGISFIIINVINSLNYKELVQMVEMGAALKAKVWLKPLEIHNDVHRKYSIRDEELPEFRALTKKAIERAEELNVHLDGLELLQAIVKDSE